MRGSALASSLFFLIAAGCDGDPCGGSCAAGEVCAPAAGVCRCGALSGPVCEDGDTCLPDHEACMPPIPEPVCGTGTRWAPGQPAFRDATDAWGLTGVLGVRLSVTDVDGDGWADLEVRRGSLGPDDFDDPAGRRTWLLRNTGAGRFEDITQASDLLSRRAPDGRGRPVSIVAWGDVDGDGDLDVYTGLDTTDPAIAVGETSEILLNDGAGTFTLGPADNPVRRASEGDIPAGASFVDVDHDGHLDLFVPQHNSPSFILYQDRVWRGDGTGRFEDMTVAAGITTEDWVDLEAINEGRAHSRAWSANACDLDDDGFSDLLVASYGRAPNHLWRSTGPGTFENHSVASGYAYDGDQMWQDNEFARCFCEANPDAEDCAGVPAPRLVCADNWNHDTDRQPFRLGGNSGATICGDLDNDGDLDLLTTEIKHWWAGSSADGSEVLVNDGTATFTRPGDAALGLAIDHSFTPSWDEGHMTAAIFDFDNDGWADVYIGGSDYAGNRGLLYHHTEEALAFEEVPPADGIDHNRSHGVVVADFDRDGDLDVVVGHSRARCDPAGPNDCYPTQNVRFFENLAGQGGNFVSLDLEGGEGTNRAAIGARVRVTASGVRQTQEVGGGHGHYGTQNDLVLHFGLGAACEAEVEVRWPDAALTTETFTLPAGHRFRLPQGGPPILVRPPS